MDRPSAFDDNEELRELYVNLQEIYKRLSNKFITELDRLPPLPDLFVDRWQRAALLGFGKGTNIYDSSLVLGQVKIGSECWIGPNTILDGSGHLVIGDCCTISAGVHIYTHDNVKQTLSGKAMPIEREPVTIGSNVYVGPQAIITKGTTIGNNVVIGAFSLINKDVPDNSIVMGQPGKVTGSVLIDDEGKINFKYSAK
ncbi:acyltransferase [Adhaeribacter soli]|uniref:Acyltransferase n=1 Tax=Adhaeribacter soli TaxID=2607655 RepID=A0A5N1IR31_9BACT|nr:acyltransferase [Adhaeribacter soli]KAA9327406.1 acyltransferase [Adhaeribacter soli]